MQTTYKTMTTEARNYLMRSKLLKTVEDITYGISVLSELLGLERTEEVTKLIQEVDKKNVSTVKNMTMEEIVDIDAITLITIMNRYTSKRRVTYANKVWNCYSISEKLSTPEIEDFIYGMSLLEDLSGLDQTEEVISLTKEVDKKNDSIMRRLPIE